MERLIMWLWVALLPLCVAPSMVARKADGRPNLQVSRDEAVRGDLYRLPPGVDRLRDFTALRPVGAVYLPSLDIPGDSPASNISMMIGDGQSFAADFHGRFTAAKTGTYRFQLESKESARLFIDGRTVIDDDGAHQARSDTRSTILAAGPHGVEVQYFSPAGRPMALRLACQSPGGRLSAFPACGMPASSSVRWRVWLVWVAALASLGATVIWQTRHRVMRESQGAR